MIFVYGFMKNMGILQISHFRILIILIYSLEDYRKNRMFYNKEEFVNRIRVPAYYAFYRIVLKILRYVHGEGFYPKKTFKKLLIDLSFLAVPK